MLRAELGQLRSKLAETQSAAARSNAALSDLELDRLNAIQRAERESAERAEWEALAEEAEQGRLELAAQLQAARVQAALTDAPHVEIVAELARDAAAQLDLDESSTRALIDQQLRDAGWEVDTKDLRFASGARPVKGRNRAIAEWPTMSGPADYALFFGLNLVATVEAKRRNRNVMEVLRQAERYASDIHMEVASFADDGPWNKFKAPFAFATNGRPYLKQVAAFSGIWRRDLREDDSPAERAGLKPGDIVTKVNGKDVTADQTVSFLVANLQPGTKVPLEVLRDNARINVSVTLGKRPSEAELQNQAQTFDPDAEEPMAPGTSDQTIEQKLGMQVMPITPGVARSLGLALETKGVVVAAVDPNADAARKGLRRGDVILSANYQPVTTVEALVAQVNAAVTENREAILLRIQRGTQPPAFIAIRLR